MTRMTIVLIAFLSMPLMAGEYKEIRNLTLDANNLDEFSVEATSGLLEITGHDDIDQIIVKATIRIDTKMSFDEQDAREYAAKNLTLELEAKGNKGKLIADFESDNFSFFNSNRLVDLEIQVPAKLYLAVKDGSGSINISNMNSGAYIDDGSGSLEVSHIKGDVKINDGSGSITIDQIQGRVNIDDGSGSLQVSNIQGDLTIEDGSGGIDITDIKGSVTIDDGSGSISVKNVSGDFILLDDGSGRVSLVGVQGDIRGYDDHDRDRNKRRDLK